MINFVQYRNEKKLILYIQRSLRSRREVESDEYSTVADFKWFVQLQCVLKRRAVISPVHLLGSYSTPAPSTPPASSVTKRQRKRSENNGVGSLDPLTPSARTQ